MANKIKLYALSTCIHCRHAREFLDGSGVEYDHLYVDKLTGEERQNAIAELKKFNPRASFPTLVVNDGDQVVVGFFEDRFKEALGI